MTGRLEGKCALVTQAGDYMGPAIAALFEQDGASVHKHTGSLREQTEVDELVAEMSELDILVANFAMPPKSAAVGEIVDDDWFGLFDALVHPLMRIVRAVAPGMVARGGGKIVAVTSAAPLRGIAKTSSYCAARGAQNAFIRAVGLELAPKNVQVNAIGQNYVKNNTYYPPDLIESERFQKHVSRQVPIQRVAESSETAELALFLASDKSNFIVAQIVPFAGGWVTTS